MYEFERAIRDIITKVKEGKLTVDRATDEILKLC